MSKNQIYISSILTFSVGLNLFIIAFNNIFDFNSNWEFVKHVLLMDTTFPGNSLQWRAIHSETIQMIFYIGIITAEMSAAILCLTGAFKILRQQYFVIAYYGLTLSVLIWFGAFITVGGEWFLMWQSNTWNGMNPALRYFTVSFLVLIYITLIEKFPRKSEQH
jgi:predicted small integral membrane protein